MQCAHTWRWHFLQCLKSNLNHTDLEHVISNALPRNEVFSNYSASNELLKASTWQRVQHLHRPWVTLNNERRVQIKCLQGSAVFVHSRFHTNLKQRHFCYVETKVRRWKNEDGVWADISVFNFSVKKFVYWLSVLCASYQTAFPTIFEVNCACIQCNYHFTVLLKSYNIQRWINRGAICVNQNL